jgi:hypothetical protein
MPTTHFKKGYLPEKKDRTAAKIITMAVFLIVSI